VAPLTGARAPLCSWSGGATGQSALYPCATAVSFPHVGGDADGEGGRVDPHPLTALCSFTPLGLGFSFSGFGFFFDSKSVEFFSFPKSRSTPCVGV
jgi:hypothetical protein